MSFEAFLKIESIAGESRESGHEEWIELLGWKVGLSQPSSGVVSGDLDRPPERVNFDAFSISKLVDKASPLLMNACATGKHLDEVTIETCRHIETTVLYLKYVLSDCVVQHLNWSAVPQGNTDLPNEELAILYGKIEMTYTELDDNHQPGGDYQAFWNLSEYQGG